MRSFLLLAFMTPFFVMGLEQPTLFYQFKPERTQEYRDVQAQYDEFMKTYRAERTEQNANEKDQEWHLLLDKLDRIRLAFQKKLMPVAIVIGRKMQATAVLPYDPTLAWVNPEFDITQRIIDVLDFEYAKEIKCTCVCE